MKSYGQAKYCSSQDKTMQIRPKLNNIILVELDYKPKIRMHGKKAKLVNNSTFLGQEMVNWCIYVGIFPTSVMPFRKTPSVA